MNSNKFILALLLLCGLCGAAFADGIDEPIPSFYQEPGISRTRDYSDQHPAERIDPFTGKLQWHFVDLFIPGNGGMDIKVQRSYTSPGLQWPEPSPIGLGWTMHFGRVIRRASIGICTTTSTDARQDPVLELPDGSRRILYVALDGASFISSDFWKAVCDPGGNGLVVYSPDGTSYSMTSQGVAFGSASNTQNVFYTTRMTDRNGNWMAFAYNLVPTGGAAVSSITTSDGRSVNFAYTANALTSVGDGSRTWNYVQTQAPGAAVMQLTQVQRPDGTSWNYDYNDGTVSAGTYAMKRITYPTGGTINYTYGTVQFSANPAIPTSTVVTQKVSNPGGTWTWTYTPASQPFPYDANGNLMPMSVPPSNTQIVDQTVEAGPVGTRTYYHFGYNSASNGYVYAIGTLLGTSSSVQNESYSFTPMLISNQPNIRPGGNLTFDSATAAVLTTQHAVGRSAETFTTSFSNFDGYGNPGTITDAGSDTRTTSLTYFIDPTKWILRIKKNESIQQGAETYATTRTFDPVGNMLSQTRAGVTTNFTYTPEGDLATRTDANSNVTTYSSYYRGIARTESQPEGVTISRTVSDAGNITAQTDGEQATTSFTYDGLNRVTGVTRPAGNPITVAWTSTTRQVSRGASNELTTYDGFGRVIANKHSDTGTGQIVSQSYLVDELGRRTYASYPGSVDGIPNSTIGVKYAYDLLNRLKSVIYDYATDGSYTTYASYGYQSYSTSLLNERGLTYVFRNRMYGDPDKRELLGVTDPVSNVENTVIARNVPGLVTSVTQNNVVRTYNYNSNYFLTSVVEPETGITTFGRDAIGNMISRQVGSATASAYSYDGRNRLTGITYPTGTPSVTNVYYKDDKLKSVDNGVARHDYQYDGNKNLLSETMTFGTRTFTVGYAYNGNDALSTLTYGSGSAINFAPDAFGRPTQVGPYVTSVAYHPSGQPSSFMYGNGVQTTINYNNRQWPANMEIAKGGDLFNTSYMYDGIGNVTSISDSVDNSYTRSMTYDGLERLTGINGPWGTGTVGYDLNGNITSQSLGSTSLNYTYDNATLRLTSVAGSKLYTIGYDTYGNVTNNGTMAFSYDDAANMRCAKCGQSDQILFDYDGGGHRVHLQKSNSETFFVYGQGGQLLWEQTPGAKLKEYFYLHGKAVATREQPSP